MSVNVNIPHKGQKLDFEALLKSLADTGLGLVVNDLSENHVQFYLNKISTRPIDITLEDDGTYEVRTTTMASLEDYRLFSETVGRVISMLDSYGLYEGDPDEKFQDASAYLNDDWIKEHSESDYRVTTAMAFHDSTTPGKGSEIGLFGPVNMFYIGKRLLSELKIELNTPYEDGFPKLIERFRYTQYSHPWDIRITSDRLRIKSQEEGGKDKSVTCFARGDYDMITKADYIAIEVSKGNLLLLDYDNFIKIAPKEWERIDDSQYMVKDLSDSQWEEFISRAEKFNEM